MELKHRHPGTAVTVLVAGLLGLAALGLACGGGGAKEDKHPTLTVNSTADSDKRDDELTLREALLVATGKLSPADLSGEERDQVNGSPGAGSGDMVLFDESVFPQDDPATVMLDSSLPIMRTGKDVVDGKDRVIVDGKQSTLVCFTIWSDANELRNLRVHNCQTAILVREGVGNVIGRPGDGNLLSGNQVGIEVRAEGTIIQDNTLGLDARGLERMANEFEGIWVTSEARDTIIGGTGPGEGNLISSSGIFGISVEGALDTVIQGNVIGLDSTGEKALGNKYGIAVQRGAGDTLIGGTEAGSGNVISGNANGVLVRDAETTGTNIEGNNFGTDVAGEVEVANSVDVWVINAGEHNVIGDNTSIEALKVSDNSGTEQP